MYRNIINEFSSWYEKKSRRILCVKGALGVGKTWAVKDFATAFFKEQLYIDLSQLPVFTELIISSSVGKFYSLLLETFPNADLTESLIILDEVPNTSECAQFFHAYRHAHPDHSICLIFSSIEVTEYEYTHPDLYEIVRMRPMSFEEYMIASKAHPLLEAIEREKNNPLTHFELIAIRNMLREYMLTGGMPEVVHKYLTTKDFSVIRPTQNKILESYNRILYHIGTDAFAQRCRRIWRSVPKQLTNDNKKFKYRLVEDNARSREYAEATQALCNLGFVRKLPRLLETTLPLEDHADNKSFKLFLLDHGLLRAIYDLPVRENITLEEIFLEKNNAIAEQYVFQELSYKSECIYYWISKATARVPFIYEAESKPIPVDIRFIPNCRAQNIKAFSEKNNTQLSLRISLDQVSYENNIINIPAFGLWNL